jgi:hypothetical protein
MLQALAMSYILVLFVLMLLWKWRIRDLIKRALILFSIPFLHMHFLQKAENPLAFQSWSLLGLVVFLVVFAYRLRVRLRRRVS